MNNNLYTYEEPIEDTWYKQHYHGNESFYKVPYDKNVDFPFITVPSRNSIVQPRENLFTIKEDDKNYFNDLVVQFASHLNNRGDPTTAKSKVENSLRQRPIHGKIHSQQTRKNIPASLKTLTTKENSPVVHTHWLSKEGAHFYKSTDGCSENNALSMEEYVAWKNDPHHPERLSLDSTPKEIMYHKSL